MTANIFDLDWENADDERDRQLDFFREDYMAYEPGELFIYRNGDSYELGKVLRENSTGDGYFCFYHSGETAANTPARCMHKLKNAYAIEKEDLGGERGKL